MPTLPARPSAEYLRKRAKRRARERDIGLAAAQRALAREYGYRTWAELMQYVAQSHDDNDSLIARLFDVVRRGDVQAVRTLLASGANPRLSNGREAPLHIAARHGPAAVVEALIEGGALEWQPNNKGRTPLDVARSGRAKERTAIIALLDRNAISDASFRAAVDAIHAGDVATLARLLDDEPRLLHERILGPDVYRMAERHQYFLDPKLFWFIAYNPTIAKHMPPNIVDVAQIMLDRGVDRADIVYALELVMSGRVAREQGHQLPLMHVLMATGAKPSRQAVIVAAAHSELEPLRDLLANGYPNSAPIAAALGDNVALQQLLATADREDIQAAFSLAVMNGRLEAVTQTLAAGANVNAFLAVHAHSTALHQAAVNDDPALIALLRKHGAREDMRDKFWDSTPLDWALHENKPKAIAALESK